MKNIHLLATDKPSRLYLEFGDGPLCLTNNLLPQTKRSNNQHIYITSANEVKANVYALINGVLCKTETREGKIVSRQLSGGGTMDICKSEYLEIILTTDQDLIKDGVQKIDDEFLEWFVKNPSCEVVEYVGDDCYYEIIIPQEEPKQLFTKGDKVLFTGKMLNEEVVDKVVTVSYILGRGDITDMSEIVDEYTHIYKVWNKDLKHIPKEEPKQETLEEDTQDTAIRFLEWYRRKNVFFQFHHYHIPNPGDKNWEQTVFHGDNSYLTSRQLFAIFKKETYE